MDITKFQKSLLNKHLDLVLDANKKVNLTRITNKREAEVLHIEDSLASLDIINKLPEGELADLGSGSGFPGIPLGICTNRQITLVETTKKKTDFLNIFIKELNLDNVSVFNGRIEEFSKINNSVFTIVTARALSSIASLLELSSPILKINGYLICYKTNHCDEEIKEANKACNTFGFEFVENIDIPLSDKETIRRFVIYKKISESKIKLPRKMGFAQKKPII